jgi:hypothetical protein
LLAAGDSEGLLEAGFRLLWRCHRALQQQFASEPIQFRIPPAHPALGQRRQRLGQCLQPLGGLPHLGGHLGEQGKVIRSVPCRTRRSVGGQALMDLRYSLLRLPTLGQRPALQGRCHRQVLRKLLVGRDGYSGLGVCPGLWRFPAKVM